MSFPTSEDGKRDSIYKTDSTARHMLGTRLAFPDGRAYRYAHAKTAITIGRAVGFSERSTQGNLNKDGLVAATCARTTAQWDDGTHTFIVATTATASSGLHIEANNFDDGYLWINDEAGEGQLMQIKSHGVTTSSGSTACTITMYDEELLTVALTTASQWGLVQNLYKDTRIHTGLAGGGPALGVAPIAVGAGEYYWLQTWGPCPVFADAESLVVGEEVAVGSGTGCTVAGGAYPQDTTESDRNYMMPLLGYSLVAQTGGDEFALVYLTCAP